MIKTQNIAIKLDICFWNEIYFKKLMHHWKFWFALSFYLRITRLYLTSKML